MKEQGWESYFAVSTWFKGLMVPGHLLSSQWHIIYLV